MKHWYKRPHEAIADYVRTVLVIGGAAGLDPEALPLFTNGMQTLFFRMENNTPGKEKHVQLTLFGNSIPEDYWTCGPSTTLIAYFFKPFSMAPVFDISATKLAKHAMDLDTWKPHLANALKMQLLYAAPAADQIKVLDNLLIQLIKENKRKCDIIHYATEQIMCHPDIEILPILHKELKLNERTFQRMFKKYVGITPVEYRRICQFQVSFAHLKGKEFTNISDVAFDNGFSDQSHFIRTFKEFTKVTPGKYLKTGLKGKT